MTNPMLQLAVRIDAFSLRERAVMVISLWIALVMLGWLPFLMDPINLKINAAEQSLQKARMTLSLLDSQKETILARRGLDPNLENNTRLKLIKSDVIDLTKSLADLTDNLIAPTDMAQALRDLLKADSRLQLIAVESIPAEPILPKETTQGKTKAAPGPATILFRHGLRIEFEADYMAGLEYLARIETLPWAFYWDKLQVTATQYPKNRFVLIVNTISFDKDWIGV